MVRIDTDLIEQTSAKAKNSERLRMNYNFHPRLDDPVSRMLNAMEPGTYIRPHKHQDPDRWEVFIALRGRFVVFVFDNDGAITDQAILDASQGKYGVEIPAKAYHCLLSLETGSVAYEIKEGPYMAATAKNFASWAPPEGSPQAKTYMQGLLHKAGLKT